MRADRSRHVRAFAVLLVAGSSGAAWSADGAVAPVPHAPALEDCLLEALARAAPQVTVGELRAGCAGEPASRHARPARPDAPADAGDPVGWREQADRRARFGLLPHRPTYFLPISHTGDLAPRDPGLGQDAQTEIKFQLSFKLPLFGTADPRRASFFVGYTLQAWWQAYQFDRSNPFREYNHEPEFFYSMPLERTLAGWRLARFDAGFSHHSNGSEEGESRSWNRFFVDLRAERGNWWTSVRPWWRIPEAVFKANRDSKDDNVDIGSYYGYGEWRLGYVAEDGASATALLRWNPSSGRGAVQLDLSTPTGFNPRIRWYLQGFAGYGESLANYDRVIRRASVGLMFSDWY
ncbi:MAG: phospholipase A [Lautropia sp.]